MLYPFVRLRTQLIFSHLTAISFTLVSMVAAVVIIAGSWWASQQGAFSPPTQDARSVAGAIAGLVARPNTAASLDPVLRALASGDLRLASGPWRGGYGPAQRFDWFGASLSDVTYIVVIGPNGRPLASSEPGGAAFAPPEHDEWAILARTALNGVSSPRQLVLVRSGSEPAALGAYPVVNASGQPIAAVVVATRTAPPANAGSSFWQGLLFFGAASAAVLAGASVFAFVSSGIVGWLLSRGLVSRLERLGQAVESLATGDLTQHVDEGRPDEVGQLARRFNYMADRLATTVAELEAARDRTEAALRTKRELVANVSHELRTPLALIRSHVESLGMPGSDADRQRQREYLTIIERETERLSGLIDDLFALSMAEAGALPLTIEPVSLATVIEEVASSIAPVARRERQVTVVASAAADLPLALADRQRVAQVLGNLVRNALRHTPEGGLIAIRAEKQDDQAVVTVEDTGEGIPPERLAHIFERFYRGDAARDRASGGAGLGLAIVRELVEAMGGDVSVESRVGQGSRFSFRLPLVIPQILIG